MALNISKTSLLIELEKGITKKRTEKICPACKKCYPIKSVCEHFIDEHITVKCFRCGALMPYKDIISHIRDEHNLSKKDAKEKLISCVATCKWFEGKIYLSNLSELKKDIREQLGFYKETPESM